MSHVCRTLQLSQMVSMVFALHAIKITLALHEGCFLCVGQVSLMHGSEFFASADEQNLADSGLDETPRQPGL